MTKTIELTEYQAKLVWSALNAAQHQGIKYLMAHESGLHNDNEVLEDWYNEAVQEYVALKDVKNQLGWED